MREFLLHCHVTAFNVLDTQTVASPIQNSLFLFCCLPTYGDSGYETTTARKALEYFGPISLIYYYRKL